jgi:pimeloyl-ACP methyl ester carboxylesterase
MDVTEDMLGNGLPYLRFGSGPALVALPGSQPENGNLTGRARGFLLSPFVKLGGAFTVHVVNRRPGLPEGVTFADVAADLAEGLTATFDEPVDVLGYSTGGSVALQLAVDHPAAVRRLVVVSSAHTLSPAGARVTRDYADRARAGRRAVPAFAPVAARSAPAQAAMRAFLWFIDPMMRPSNGDHTDAIRVNEAELDFDVADRLDAVTAPTLVVGGDRDLAYPVDLMRATADGVPDGRLRIYAGRNHNSAISDPRFVADVSHFLKAGAAA